MYIGASTASLYPMNTEDALLTLAEMGIKNIEIFINCDIELQNPVRAEISKIIRDYALNILSVHPMPGWESFFLFSNYGRRTAQFMDTYSRYFERMNEWGAKVMVFHGSNKTANRSDELYLDKFVLLLETADKFGVSVAQENVAYCKSGDLDFLVRMKKELADRAAFTLDLKQAVRSGYSAFDILDKLGQNIIHIHASDNGVSDGGGDCLPIGRGSFDFTGFFVKLREMNYKGGMVLELYRENYNDFNELKESVDILISKKERAD